MKLTETSLPEVFIIEPDVFEDSRGWFFESYSKIKLEKLGIYTDFIQDNHSFSAKKNILRGLHFQCSPKAQAKLVRCTRGSILDVAVDIRKNSPFYRKWISVELSAKNSRQLFIPRGFAHGFITLAPDTEVQYKADNYYDSGLDRTILWNDTGIGVDWGTDSPILSAKDAAGKTLKEIQINFD